VCRKNGEHCEGSVPFNKEHSARACARKATLMISMHELSGCGRCHRMVENE